MSYHLTFKPISKVLLVVFIGSSCVPADPFYVPLERQKENIYYTPKTPDAPLLSEKNDYTFSVLYAAGEKHKGFDIKASYSPVNHLGLMANYNAYYGVSSETQFSGGDFGAGYYTSLSKLTSLEVYGGAGINKVQNHHYSGNSRFNQSNLFLQPAFVFHDQNGPIQFALVSKFNKVNYTFRDSTFSNDRESWSASQVKLLVNHPDHMFWEPGFIFRAGSKSMMFQLGFSFVSDLTNSELNYSKTHFSLGLHFKLPIKEEYAK
ncbi:MAG: hypothetical protein ACM3VS_04280 [Candidatus Dadabacteria bacterium]